MPLTVTKDASNSLTYVYSASGEKLALSTKVNGVTTVRYYAGGFEYDNAKALSLLKTDEGIVTKTNNAFVYEYYLKDHLGNTRVSFTPSGQVPVMAQRTDYYPFGLVSGQYQASTGNKYLFNGKELQSALNWNVYDYGARFYDAAIGRWHSVDPATDRYLNISPYVYCANNPIIYIDPTGMYIEEGSQKEWERRKRDVTSQKDYLQKRLDKLTAKAESKGWSSEKLSSKTGGIKESIASINGSLNIMGTLEGSSQGYSLSHTAPDENGGVTLNTETNVIDIKFGSSNTANFVHEITHAGQFESRWGHIAFDSEKGTTLAQDVYDEVQAYRAQYAYDPSSVSNLTSTSRINSMHDILPQWVQGLSGGNYYVPGGGANTGISPVYVNSTGADLMRAYPHLSYPNNYIMKTDYSTLYLKK